MSHAVWFTLRESSERQLRSADSAPVAHEICELSILQHLLKRCPRFRAGQSRLTRTKGAVSGLRLWDPRVQSVSSSSFNNN